MVKEILMLCLFAQQATRVTAFPQNFNHEEFEQQLMLEDAEFKQKAVQLCLVLPAAMLWMAGSLMGWQNMVESFMSLFGYNTLPIEPINITPTISVGPFKAAPKTSVGPAKGYYLPGEIEYHPIMDVIKKQNLENQRRQEEIIKFHIQEQERLELLNNLPVQSGISGRHLLSDLDYTQMQKDLEGNFTLIIDLYKSLGHKFSTKKCTKEFNEFVKNSTDILYQTILDYETSVSFTCTMPDTYKAACLIAPVTLDPLEVGDCQIDKVYKIDNLIEVKYNGTTFVTSARPYETTISNALTLTPRLDITQSPSEEQQKTASHSLPETVTMIQDDLPSCYGSNEAFARKMMDWYNSFYKTNRIFNTYAYVVPYLNGNGYFNSPEHVIYHNIDRNSVDEDGIFLTSIAVLYNNVQLTVSTPCKPNAVNCSDANSKLEICRENFLNYNSNPDMFTQNYKIDILTVRVVTTGDSLHLTCAGYFPGSGTQLVFSCF